MANRLRGRIPASTLSFTFSHSGGPGGQNVNKVSTRATLWFDLEGSAELTADEKARIRSALGGRIGLDGRLRVASMRHRTQRANREAAVDRFYELLAAALTPPAARKATKLPRRAKERRLEHKRQRSTKKRMRRGSADAVWD